MKSRTVIATFVASLVCSALAATAAAATPRELFRNPFLTPSGHVANLAAGAHLQGKRIPDPDPRHRT